MKLFRSPFKILPMINRANHQCFLCKKPQHLICFKQWTTEMILEIISSAINLKCSLRDTHLKKMNTLHTAKVMILQEVNEPVLNMAVSKAATLMGANDVTITDNLLWECDYLGRVFSLMCDIIFVSTSTHKCVERFARQSTVPVLCMRSRTHASLQALATVMAVIEEYGTMHRVNVSYLGAPHPVLNSYLLLCPLLGANIKFKCCCSKSPVSPLLYKTSQEMTLKTRTSIMACSNKEDVLRNACVIIAGPTHHKKDEIKEFKFDDEDIQRCSYCRWIFFHTLPRGPEVNDNLFSHANARTYNAFDNMQYIASALMAKAINGHCF